MRGKQEETKTNTCDHVGSTLKQKQNGLRNNEIETRRDSINEKD